MLRSPQTIKRFHSRSKSSLLPKLLSKPHSNLFLPTSSCSKAKVCILGEPESCLLIRNQVLCMCIFNILNIKPLLISRVFIPALPPLTIPNRHRPRFYTNELGKLLFPRQIRATPAALDCLVKDDLGQPRRRMH